MKYFVLITLMGYGQCTNIVIYSDFKEEVSTLEECNTLAEKYSQLPFVIVSQCKTVKDK